jgi:beta-glucosidase
MIFLLFIGSLQLLLCNCIDVEKILNSMSYVDKCGQMTHIDIGGIVRNPLPKDLTDVVDNDALLKILKDKRPGSYMGVPFTAPSGEEMQKFVTQVQRAAMNQTELKIPFLWALDSIHGAGLFNTSVIFPCGLAQASTFNLDMAHNIGHIPALEMRANGVPMNFGPILDIGRQPLWPRLWETYGEDVNLAVKMGEAYVRGHQGDNNLKNRSNAAVCLKHYMGYSNPFNGRDRTPAYIPDIQLREYFLPTFAQAVKAGALGVMVKQKANYF